MAKPELTLDVFHPVGELPEYWVKEILRAACEQAGVTIPETLQP